MSKHRIDITYEIWTEEDRLTGDCDEQGYVKPDYTRSFTADRPVDGWSLREAIAYMRSNSDHIETCWTPGDLKAVYSYGPMDLYGYDSYEPGVNTQNQCMHIRNMSPGSMRRLARVLANEGVYFANVRKGTL